MQVLALVGVRKLMDFSPWLFTQKDLKWLDNLMPEKKKKKDKDKTWKKWLNKIRKDSDADADASQIVVNLMLSQAFLLSPNYLGFFFAAVWFLA